MAASHYLASLFARRLSTASVFALLPGLRLQSCVHQRCSQMAHFSQNTFARSDESPKVNESAQPPLSYSGQPKSPRTVLDELLRDESVRKVETSPQRRGISLDDVLFFAILASFAVLLGILVVNLAWKTPPQKSKHARKVD